MHSITWHIQVYEDLEYLATCLSAIRRWYPASRIFVISDGNPDPEIQKIAGRFQTECYYEERLFGVEHGGEIVHRFLDRYLAAPSDFLVKVDGDTRINRRFWYLPKTKRPLLMGKRQTAGNGNEDLVSVQGGCIAMNHAAASLMHNSKLFLDARLKPPTLAWARPGTPQELRAKKGLTSHDWTIGWVCKELKIRIYDHPEIASYWKVLHIDSRRDCLFDHRKFIRRFWPAVTHPHKLLDAKNKQPQKQASTKRTG